MPINLVNGWFQFTGEITQEAILNSTTWFAKQGNCQMTRQPSNNIRIMNGCDISKMNGLTLLIGNSRFIEYEDPTQAAVFKGIVFEFRTDITNFCGKQLAIENCVANYERTGNDGASFSSVKDSSILFRNTGATSGNDRGGVLIFQHSAQGGHRVYENTFITSPFRWNCTGAVGNVNNQYNFYCRGLTFDSKGYTLAIGGNWNPVICFEDIILLNANAGRPVEGFVYNNNSDAGIQPAWLMMGKTIDSFFNGGNSIPYIGRTDGDDGNRRIITGGKKYWRIFFGAGSKIEIISPDNLYGDKLNFDPDALDWFGAGTQKDITTDLQDLEIVVTTGYSPMAVKNMTVTKYAQVPRVVITGFEKNTIFIDYENMAEAEATEGTPTAYAPIVMADDPSVTGTEADARLINGLSFDAGAGRVSITESVTLDQVYNWSKIYEIDNKGFRIFDANGAAVETVHDVVFSGDGSADAGDKFSQMVSDKTITDPAGSSIFTDQNGTRLSFQFSIINPLNSAYEWRLYETATPRTLEGCTELSGQESATGQDQAYSYFYTNDRQFALQIIALDDDFKEFVGYFDVTRASVHVNITLERENNN